MENAPSSGLRVYVNGRPVEIASGATAMDAVHAFDPAEAAQVRASARAITDSRGIVTAPEGAAYSGAIYRTVRGDARGDVE